jgi:uncharacterized membrane protein
MLTTPACMAGVVYAYFMNNQEEISKMTSSGSSAKTKQIAFTGLFAAIIFVATAFLKIPAGPGYINLGDAFIFLACFILGPYGIIAAMLGSGLADLLAGYFIYIPATVVIKGLMALVAYLIIKKNSKLPLIILATIIGELIMSGGYFLYEIPIYGFEVAVADLVFNFIQAIGGVIIGTLVVFLVAKYSNNQG